jgi:hypothetical protein
MPGAVPGMSTRCVHVYRVVPVARQLPSRDYFANFIEDFRCFGGVTRRWTGIYLMSEIADRVCNLG